MNLSIKRIDRTRRKQTAQAIKGSGLAQPNLQHIARHIGNQLRRVFQASALRHHSRNHPVQLAHATVPNRHTTCPTMACDTKQAPQCPQGSQEGDRRLVSLSYRVNGARRCVSRLKSS